MNAASWESRFTNHLQLADRIRGGIVHPIWLGGDRIAFRAAEGPVILDATTGEREPVGELPAPSSPVPRRIKGSFKVGRPDVFEVGGPGGEFFATELGDDLALRWEIDGRTVPLTTSGTPDHRFEVKGSKWSPDGFRLLARRIDTRGMDRFPVVHWLKPSEEVEFFPAGRVGGRVESMRLVVVDRLTRRVVEIDTGAEPEQDLRPLGWSADGRALLVKTDRYKSRFSLLAADPDTGATETLFTEVSATWVSYWEKGVGATLLPGGDGFVWMSERDGWARLYRYDAAGALVNRITEGEWPVTKVLAIDPVEARVIFEAHSDVDRPYDTHVCSVGLDGTGFRQLTTEPGTHSGTVSPDHRLIVDHHSSVNRLPAVDLYRAEGTFVARLAEATFVDADQLVWTEAEEFIVPAADGTTDLHGLIYHPSGFDPAGSYPVIESIYAGPNSAYVPQTAQAETSLRARALAEAGFVVVVVDGRGTPERSKAFHDVAYRDFAGSVISDHVSAISALAADRPYLDLSRVGVFGRSYGGYFTARALLEAPEFYQVGVAINGVYEMREGNGAGPIEVVMGPLRENVAGYDALDLLPMAERLAGKLMLVHGTSDVNVAFSASLRMVEALTKAKKSFDFLPVNEQPHHFSGYRGEYVNLVIARYFDEHLRGTR